MADNGYNKDAALSIGRTPRRVTFTRVVCHRRNSPSLPARAPGTGSGNQAQGRGQGLPGAEGRVSSRRQCACLPEDAPNDSGRYQVRSIFSELVSVCTYLPGLDPKMRLCCKWHWLKQDETKIAWKKKVERERERNQKGSNCASLRSNRMRLLPFVLSYIAHLTPSFTFIISPTRLTGCWRRLICSSFQHSAGMFKQWNCLALPWNPLYSVASNTRSVKAYAYLWILFISE